MRPNSNVFFVCFFVLFVLLAKKVSIRITSSKTLEFIVAKNPKKVYKFNFLHLILNSDVDTIVMLEDIRLENNYFSEYEDKNLTVETVACNNRDCEVCKKGHIYHFCKSR
jgi:hypothetical protein